MLGDSGSVALGSGVGVGLGTMAPVTSHCHPAIPGTHFSHSFLHLRQLSMPCQLILPREDAGEAQHALPCQASAFSALFPNNPGIAFLLRRRTSSRMWSTPCCKPTGPQGCRCWKATSWYSSRLAPRPRDTGMGGGSQPFYQGTLLAACLSEAKRATENKSWKLNC